MRLTSRVVMAPMTRSFSPGGVPGEDVADYYARRAASDVGLIITEGTTVKRPGASFDDKVPNFHEEKALNGWQRVCNDVHAVGGSIAPQLWHVGMMRKPGTGPNPDAQSDSPSGITHSGKQVAPVLSTSEVDDIVLAFADAAENAAKLGFDAIEIHGAHGYLIDQFFWETMNTRDDKYGGDLVGRASFARDIIRECRKRISPDMPIILRFSQWKQQEYGARLAENPAELETFLNVFVEAGVDMFHCSQRRYWEPEFEGSDLNLAGWTKKLSGLPTISVGSVGLNGDFFGAFAGQDYQAASIDQLIERMEAGEFDLIAVGRALLQDPNWASKVKEGRLDELQDYDGKALASLV